MPPPRQTIAEWAAQERKLSPEASAEPGQWMNERAPHAVAPMEAMSPGDPCETVVLKWSAQSAKSEVLLNCIGFYASNDPGPIMAIQPNMKPMGESFSKDRVSPMFRDTPSLSNMFKDTGRRESNNTISHKVFPGGHLTIAGANSPSSLASRPIRILLMDEVDRFEATKEGDAQKLAEKRTRTFHNRKILKVSTPTYENFGIDAEYDVCQQQWQWHLACLHCGEYQFPIFKFFQFDKENPEATTYSCGHCGAIHTHEDEFKVKATGKWVCLRDSGDKSKGFHFNQWASPFARWSETVTEFLNAKDDPQKLQTVINTAFAETWSEQGDSVDPDSLMGRRENYDVAPADVLLLVAGVDVQDDRLEMEVVGYGEGEESWGIEYNTIWGDPGRPDVWRDLDAALQRDFKTEDGRRLNIAAACVDSGGHHTSAVYDFCSKRAGRRVFAIKGMAGEGKPIVSASNTKRYGRTGGNVRLFTVGVDTVKRIVMSRLNIDDGPGSCHFPTRYDEEYFAQLTAEEIRTKYIKGVPTQFWYQTRKRNEALDIRVYALAALKLLNPVWTALKDVRDNPVEKPKQKPKQSRPFATSWKN